MTTEAYLCPKTVEECLNMLASYHGESSIIAGGTDLMLSIKERKVNPKALIDITGIPELTTLEWNTDSITIGAGITHARVATDIRIKKEFPALAAACVSVGSPQIRNIATLGGNIVSAQPAADSAVALISLGAKAEIISAKGKRLERIEDLYVGVGKSKIDCRNELVSRIIIERSDVSMGTAFTRVAPREALALPIVNCAVWVVLKDETIVQTRIVIGPVSTHPFRPHQAEEKAIGTNVHNHLALMEAAQLAAQEASPRDSLLRGSSTYRRTLVCDLVNRALTEAVNNARGR